MTSGNGQQASESTAYLLPKDSQPPGQSAVYRPANKAQLAEEGRESFPTTVATTKPGADILPPTLLEQACAALFYASASLVVIFVNKVRVGSVLSCMDPRARDAFLHRSLVVGTVGSSARGLLLHTCGKSQNPVFRHPSRRLGTCR